MVPGEQVAILPLPQTAPPGSDECPARRGSPGPKGSDARKPLTPCGSPGKSMSPGPLPWEKAEKGDSAQNSLGIFHRPCKSSWKVLRILLGTGLLLSPQIWMLEIQPCRSPLTSHPLLHSQPKSQQPHQVVAPPSPRAKPLLAGEDEY